MNFMKDFIKNVEKIDGISLDSTPPKYWISTGCYNLNKIISGSFFNGIPQGRVVSLAGPSGSGKSYLLGNIIKNAQQDGAINIVLDSERSLSDDFMQKIGVDTKKDYCYVDVTTIDHVVKITSDFLKGYKKQYEDDPDSQPKVIISIDSLDMLLTESEDENFNKGVQKGDQGQKTKQLKQMLKTLVNGIKHDNISVITTSQVYKNQDLLNGEGQWILNNAVKYSGSQTILLTKSKLRNAISKEVEGIKMIAEGIKTRFTKPFQKVTIEVPYDKGMNKYSGLLETFVSMNILEQKGAWYYLVSDNTIKFQSKNFEQHVEKLLEMAEKVEDAYIDITKNNKDNNENIEE